MSKLPVLSGREVAKLLSKIGYNQVRTTGSHTIMRKDDPMRGKIVIPVPLHKELAPGTLKSIIGQAGLSKEEFEELVKQYL